MFVFLLSDKGSLYYPSPTRDSLLPLSHKIPSLFQVGKRFFIIILSEDFFTIPVRQTILRYASLKDSCTIPVRQTILYHSSLTGFLQYSSPTKDSVLFLSQRISSVFHSDKGFFVIPLSKDVFIIPVRQRILYYSSLNGFLYYSLA